MVWLTTLLVLATNLIAYDSVSSISWLVLLAGLIAFNVGAFLALPRALHSGALTRPVTISEIPLIGRRALFFACLVYFLSFGVYLYTISTNYGLAVLLNDPGSIRAISLDGKSYLSRTPQLARLGLNLGPVLLVIFAVRESVRRPLAFGTRALLVFVIVVSMLAMLQRTNLFMAILWYLAYLMSRNPSEIRSSPQRRTRLKASPARFPHAKRKKGFVLAAVCGLLGLVLAFQFLGNALGKTGQQALSTDRVDPVLEASGFSNIYVYGTAAVPAFLKLVDSTNEQWPPERVPGQQLVGDYNPQTYGAATFALVLEFIPYGRDWNPIAPFMNVGVLTNVFTWFEHPYRDFRVFGVVFFGGAMGFLVTRLFVNRFSSARLYWIQSAFFSTIFLSTFVAKTGTAIFWTGILFVFIVTWLDRFARSDAAL